MSGSAPPTNTRVRIDVHDSSPSTRGSTFEEVTCEDAVEGEIHFTQDTDYEQYDGVPLGQPGGNDSEAESQAGSDMTGYAGESIFNYIDMTRGNFCMVNMSRQKDGERIPCVCGNPKLSCTRAGHQEKRGLPNKEGLPRFYVKLPGSRGTCDGRLDRTPLTRSEGQRALSENRDEMERAAQVLGSVETDEDSGDNEIEDVTPGTNRNKGRYNLRSSTRNSNVTTDELTPVKKGWTNTAILSDDDPDDDPEIPITWVGLEHPVSHSRIIYRDDTEERTIDAALDRGYMVRKTFPTENGAQQWASKTNVVEALIEKQNQRHPKNNQVTSRTSASAQIDLTGNDRDEYDEELSEETFFSSQKSPKSKKSKTKKRGEKRWYGLERNNTRKTKKERAITTSWTVVQELLRERYKMEAVFQNKYDAECWLNETLDYDSDDTAESDESGDVHFSSARQPIKRNVTHVPSRHQPKQTSCQGPANVKKTTSLASADFFTVQTAGEDPSFGNKELIYGITHDDIDEMDAALCPPHMTPEDRTKFINTVVDITALPGMFRNGDNSDLSLDTDLATSIVATALGKEASKPNAVWQTPTRNSLSKVKTQEQLNDMIVGVEKSGKLAFQQQEGRMKSIMYKLNYDRPSILLYLQAGLLPRMMQYSYKRYLALLCKARQKAIDHGGWDNSFGYEMIAHHASETLYCRHYATDWRDFVIKTNLYLRDADHKSYVDTTMYEGLYKLVRPSALTDSKSKTPAAESPHICSHCRIQIGGDVHPGGRYSCIFKDLDAKKAKDAGRLLLHALKDSPKLDRPKKIKELVEEMGGGK